jgi:hypothetical protein
LISQIMLNISTLGNTKTSEQEQYQPFVVCFVDITNFKALCVFPEKKNTNRMLI